MGLLIYLNKSFVLVAVEQLAITSTMPRLEHHLIKDFRVKRYQLETKLGDTVVSCYLLVREFTEIIDELKHANACIRIDCCHGRSLVTYRPRFFRPWCSNVSRANI